MLAYFNPTLDTELQVIASRKNGMGLRPPPESCARRPEFSVVHRNRIQVGDSGAGARGSGMGHSKMHIVFAGSLDVFLDDRLPSAVKNFGLLHLG